jgi:thiol:disulfide interchange protein DsbD
LNWGFQFQNPWILTGLTSAVFVFGLNLIGVFEITLSGGTNAALSSLAGKQGHGGAFMHGAFTTLLGTSCTAPYLGVTLGFAMSQPAPMVVAIFLTIAAGMSLPYLVLTSNPTLLKFLPKPGLWMERLKQLMGFVMLAVAAWLLGVLGNARGLEAISGACAFLLVLGFCCWLLGVLRNRALALLLALLLAAGGFFLFLYAPLRTGPVQARTDSSEGWEPFSPERLQAERAAGRPVFVDFTADWCVNCKVNERVALSRPEVLAAFEKRGVVKLKADWTSDDPVVTAELKKFGRASVPFYLLYAPGASEPQELPSLLTPGIVLSALEALPPK